MHPRMGYSATHGYVRGAGNPLPITHSHDLIKYLVGNDAADAADTQAATAARVDPDQSHM